MHSHSNDPLPLPTTLPCGGSHSDPRLPGPDTLYLHTIGPFDKWILGMGWFLKNHPNLFTKLNYIHGWIVQIIPMNLNGSLVIWASSQVVHTVEAPQVLFPHPEGPINAITSGRCSNWHHARPDSSICKVESLILINGINFWMFRKSWGWLRRKFCCFVHR